MPGLFGPAPLAALAAPGGGAILAQVVLASGLSTALGILLYAALALLALWWGVRAAEPDDEPEPPAHGARR